MSGIRPAYNVNTDELARLIARYGSRRGIARKSGVAKNTLTRVLKTGRAYHKTVERLSRLFGVEVKELVLDSELIKPRVWNPTAKFVSIKRGRLLGAVLDAAENIAQFARSIGIPPRTIHSMLRRRRASKKTLEKICAALGRDVMEFVEVQNDA